MKEFSVLVTSTLIALMFWVFLEVRETSNLTFITNDILETTLPIDGTIDVEYLKNLDIPADVQ